MENEFLGRKLKKILTELNDVKTMMGVYQDLSPRELQIAALIREGKSMSDISLMLKRSQNTIGNQKQSLKRKLRVKTDAEIVHFANAFEIVYVPRTD